MTENKEQNEATLSYSLKGMDLMQAQAAQDLLAVLDQESDTFLLADELARQQSQSIDEETLSKEMEQPAKTWLVWAEAKSESDSDENPAVSYPVGIGSISEGEVGIAILKAYQNQGLGRATLDKMADWAKTVGYDCLWLDVDVKNGPARHLYDEIGFVIQPDQEQLVTLPNGRVATLERRELALS
ncbi:GNAT family N-acetyltransferase [Fructobacillus sp. M1-13]|uniref:GNAT family N-acetyltransferase n=1 Tax=Fructobacillus papyriferae TaxID=2713171 RepID=A0ABS5QN24_9LACO|nr:GNAT family N-acetyltransferase [Fructobacillus papyriferae]MBS9334463.1 GNAT family N-acetyltransferase [Fructobacillus papyriferae]MCD2158452.1 GNAT family N-acetyltransferase [Fructobacillus papyriferae]